MRNNVLPLGATLAFQALVSMAALTVPAIAPAISADVDIPASYVGLFIALLYGASMASSVASGDLIRKVGAVRVTQVCLLLCAAGLGLSAVGSVPFFVAGAILLGAGYGPITPASSHVLVKTTPRHLMSLVFSVKQTGVPLGGALAGALAPLLVLAGGWRLALLAVGAGCVGICALAQAIRSQFDDDVDPTWRVGAKGVSRSLRIVAQEPALRRLAAASFLFSAVQLCLVTFLVTYLTRGLGMSLVQAGLMLAVAQTAGVVGRVVWGALADRCGRPLLVLAGLGGGMALGALAMALLAPSWPLLLTAVVSAVFGATAIGWNGVYLAEVARQAPLGQAVEATGGTLFFTFFGVLVGPPLFALVVENGGSYALAFGLLAVPTLACGAILLAQDLRSRPTAGR